MSALEDMMTGMLKKALPPEVLAAITPEKIKEYGDGVNAFVADMRGRMDRIERKLDVVLQELGNVRSNGDRDAAERTLPPGSSHGIGD